MEDIFNNADDDFSPIFELLADDDGEDSTRIRGGSRPGRSRNLERNRAVGAVQLYNDYLSVDCIYPVHLFNRRFRVSRERFFSICDELEQSCDFFKTKKDATGLQGFNKYQKCTAALRMLAYGGSSDSVDEYLRMASSTVMECMKQFAKGIYETYREQYLAPPNEEQTETLLKKGSILGFPGMIGSIDCCKWVWKNCPTAYHGQYKGKEKVPSITLEAICDDRLYFWHVYFGVAGCNNDITVLESSPLFGKISNGSYPMAC